MPPPPTTGGDDHQPPRPRWVAAGGESLTALVDRFRHHAGASPDDMTPLARDPEAVLALSRALAAHSPAGLALVTSRGRWQLAEHHRVMNELIVQAVDADEGRVIVSVSVRAGKSLLGARYTPAWYVGCNPDDNVILGAHEGPFAAEHSGFARDVLTEYGPALYGVRVNRQSAARNRWSIEGHDGGMRSVGVGGSPIGRGAHLMVIDDPLPNYEAAMSERWRERVNETWFQGTMSSRVEPGGSIIVICSRWHEEDLSGFLKERFPDEWTEIHIPALCDDPETDLLNRMLGESFWPDRWSADLLRRREREVGPVVFLAQYQQRPASPDGGIFPIKLLTPVRGVPVTDDDGVVEQPAVDLSRIVALCRGWDLAATDGDGDFTVGLLLGRYDDGRWIILHMVRGQWGEARVRTEIARVRALDDAAWGPGRVLVELPQDPGQAGKAQAKQLGAMLSGALVNAERQSGDKVIRAGGLAAQVQLGNVDYLMDPHLVLPGYDPWDTRAMLDELKLFNKGKHDDIVDAGSTAFNKLAGQPLVDDPMAGQAAYGGMTITPHLR